MEYDSVPVLHKLKKKESSLRSKVSKETWNGRFTAAPMLVEEFNHTSTPSHVNEEKFYNLGRLAGVEFAIDLIENGGKHE